MHIKERKFRKYIALLTVIFSTLSTVTPVHAALIFQDDTFATTESDAIKIGSNDAGARSTAIQFGADGSAAQNGNILFDIGTRKFFVDHPVQITNLTGGDAFRVNNSVGDPNPFVITSDGDVGIGTTNFGYPSEPTKLAVEAEAGQVHAIVGKGDNNGDTHIMVMNRNSGNLATGAFHAQADNGTQDSNSLETGITNSGFSDPDFTIAGPDEAYMQSSGNSLVLATTLPTMPIKFATGGGLAANERMRIDGSGNVGINTTTPGSKLDVKGDLRLSGATSGYVGLAVPAAAGSTTYTLPSADGGAGNALVTNGSGGLSWSNATLQWQRIGTTISPVNAGDNVTTSGNISTTGTGRITSSGLFTANGGITADAGDLNLNAIGAFNTNISTGGATGAVTIGNPSAAAIGIVSGGALTLTGGAASTWGTTTGDITLQPRGAAATGLVNIGGVASATPDLLALDVKTAISGAADPAGGTNGTMYYNSSLGTFRCFSVVWGNCDTTGGTATLQSAYGASASITTSGTPIHFDLASGDFNVDGLGAVNLTPTAASQFTSGGALTLTGGATSTWGTTSGDLTLYANGSATGDVNIGADDTPSATPDILSLDLKSAASGTGDTAGGSNGDMYYNEARDRFRCFEAGGWKDCGQTAASSTTLQAAYNAGNAISTSGSDIAFTLNTTDQFTASGAGSVNLTPTGASSFTSGGALTLTGGAASTWGTSAGDLTLQANGPATGNVQIGTGGAGTTTPDLFGVDVKSNATDPAGFNGAMYYNTTAGPGNVGRFRCYEAGTWKDCDTVSLANFQAIYNNSGLVTTSGGNPISFTLAGGGFNTSGGIVSLNSTVNLPGLTASKMVFTDASDNLTTTGTASISQGGTGQTTATTAFNALSPLTTKGDMIAFNGTNNVRMPVGGADGQMLAVDSSQANGIRWITPSFGTVTSVSGSGGTTGLILNGGPITSSGTLTLGGILGLANGGTNNNITADNGAIVYSDSNKLTLLASTATAGKVLQSGISAAPTWSTPTYPSASGTAGKILRADGTNNIYSTSTFADTYTASNLLFSNGANTVQGLATANNGVLVTSGAGVPSISSTLPSAVQGNITSLGTITSGTWNGGTIAIANGGTGATTAPLALASLGAAASGANSDITSLSGLTTALAVGEGGTGQTTFGGTNRLLFTTTADSLSSIPTANNGILITSGAGVPSISSTLPSVVQGNITSLGTITSGTWNGSAIAIANGGTGQTSKTNAFDALSPLTTKGDLIAYNGTNNVRMPVGGVNGQVLAVDSSQANGMIWKTDVTGTVTSVGGSGGTTGLTLTGGPITTAGTLTLGGTLGLSNGGTNNSLTASNGGIVYSDASKLNILSNTATAGKVLQSGASGAPSWSTPTYPSGAGSAGKILRSDGTNNVYSTSTFADTYTASNLLFSNGANTVQGLATANNGVLITSGAGVPSISSTLPSAVQGNITGTGTLTSGSTGAGFTLDFSTSSLSGTVPVNHGGTGQSSYTDGQLLIGNTTGNTLTKSTLTAGTGISITNGSGTITIASTNSSKAILSGATSANAAATFIGPAGNSNNEAQVNTPIPYACTAKNLQASMEVAPAATKNLTFTIRKNSANTAVTCTITGDGATTTCSDTSNSVAFAAGDLWDVATTSTANPTAHFLKVAFECD